MLSIWEHKYQAGITTAGNNRDISCITFGSQMYLNYLKMGALE